MVRKENPERVMRDNRIVLELYSDYLNNRPRFLTEETVTDLAKECNLTKEESFLVLFAATCGLDTAENPAHRSLEKNYLRAGITALDPKTYSENAYCKTVRFPSVKHGKWELKTESFLPYEPFVRKDLELTYDFREIPQIGYFKERYDYPAVLENGVEWMTVTPNEVETMRKPIANATGNVLTLGLGLGYFAFHASEKKNVKTVTVAERDQEVIELFETYLLPQFPHRSKIKIVKGDAFDFLEKEAAHFHYDSVFADLWHDQSDGLPLYIRLRKFEKEFALPVAFDYWIEPELLSSLRAMVWDRLTDSDAPKALRQLSVSEALSDRYLRDLAADLKRI